MSLGAPQRVARVVSAASSEQSDLNKQGVPQYKFMLKNITGFQWAGILSTEDGNDKQAMPVAAVSIKSGGYVGVSSDEFGMNGLVFSQDGIYWNWDPPTVVDPSGVTLTSIATDGKGRLVVVGAADGSGGTKEGRVYTSTDGHNWTAVADSTTLFGGTAIRTVIHGPTGYVALGWNDGDPASRTIREWLSTKAFIGIWRAASRSSGQGRMCCRSVRAMFFRDRRRPRASSSRTSGTRPTAATGCGRSG